MGSNRPKKNKVNIFGKSFVFLFFILCLIATFFYFNKNNPQQDNQEIIFELSGKPEAAFGEEQEIVLLIKNKDKNKIDRVEALLNFPKDFSFEQSEPICQKKLNTGCLWEFTEIEKNAEQKIKIKGKFFGEVEQSQLFDGRLSFFLTGFSSQFQKSVSYSTIIKPSVSFAWQLPETASFGQEIESTIILENHRNEVVTETTLMIKNPSSFILTESNLSKIATQTKQGGWLIGSLEAGEKKKIVLKGFLSDPTATEAEFFVQVGLLNQDNFFSQAQKTKKIFFDQFLLIFSLKANESDEVNQSCLWGQTIPIKIFYHNQTKETVKNIKLFLKLTGGKYVDFNRFYQSSGDYYSNPDSSVASTTQKIYSLITVKSDDPSFQKFESEKELEADYFLKEIKSGQKGIISFEIPIKSGLEAAKNEFFQGLISIQALIKGEIAQGTSWEILSEQIKAPIKTEIKLESKANYYDDEGVTIGQGPLPPRVGEATRFWIFWQIKNTTNSVNEILTKTILPAGVRWTGETKATHGLILYNEKDREVSWIIPQLSSYQGGPYSLVEGGFEIEIIPDVSGVGLVLPLTEKIFFQASDSWTKDLLIETKEHLDTNLKDDFGGQNKGIVLEKTE